MSMIQDQLRAEGLCADASPRGSLCSRQPHPRNQSHQNVSEAWLDRQYLSEAHANHSSHAGYPGGPGADRTIKVLEDQNLTVRVDPVTGWITYDHDDEACMAAYSQYAKRMSAS